MTTTPPEAPSGPAPDEGPRVTREQVRDLGRLRRSRTDRKVAGVAGGLARHLDVDPVILRVAFVVLAFFGGAGLILYGACWLLVPEEGTDDAPLGLDERSRSVALIVVGILAALALLGDSSGLVCFPWPLIVLGVVALLLVTRRDSHRATEPGVPAPPAPPPAGAPWVSPAVVVPPRPVNPRRRGPVLFWFTLALIALAEGVLGIVDVAGVDVTASAYPATAVAITGLLLVVGAFYGRAGGLILVGLVATVAMAGAATAEHWDGTQRPRRPRRRRTWRPATRCRPGRSCSTSARSGTSRGWTDARSPCAGTSAGSR